MKKRLIVAVSGASGVQMAYQFLKELKKYETEVHLVISEGAERVIKEETNMSKDMFVSFSDFCYQEDDLSAPIASGSFITDGMVIIPCSMKTLSAVANAYDDNLITRAADVCLKERRKLVLIPRETPLNNAHLRNMLSVSQDGAVVIPPMLTFYAEADTIDKQIRQIIGKIMMQFDMKCDGYISWKGSKNE